MAEQIIEVEAETLEEARELVTSQIPEGFYLLSEQVISNGKPKAEKAVANTIEKAFVKARSAIPGNANILEERKLTFPGTRVIKVAASNKADAVTQVRTQHQVSNAAIIKSILLMIPGSNGVFGIGKRTPQYEVEISQPAEVEIIYQTKAKISVRIRDWPYDSHDILLLRLRGDVPGLVAVLSYKADAAIRSQAAQSLGNIKDARAVEPLITALRDEKVEMRRTAAIALGNIKDTRAVEPLITALRDEDSDMRSDAAEALGHIKDIRALDPLIAALKEESSYVRTSIVEALESIGNSRAVKPLTAILKETPADEPLHENIVKALKHLAEPEAKQVRGPIVEVVDRLTAIYQKHPGGLARSMGGPDVEAVRDIGKMLNKQGGMPMMLAVHREFARRQSWAARNLEMVWDGIGEWRG